MIEPPRDVSFAEFVAWEQEQHERHELIGGHIVPFASGSMDHETITVNIIAELHASIDPPCKLFPSTAIVQTVSRTGEDGYRPDVTVSCSPANIGTFLYVQLPRVLVEVLSPSNSGHDWDRKLFEYWNTPSIEQLVFVDSRTRYIVSHVRGANGNWKPPATIEDAGVLELAPLMLSMPLDHIYAGTSLAVNQ